MKRALVIVLLFGFAGFALTATAEAYDLVGGIWTCMVPDTPYGPTEYRFYGDNRLAHAYGSSIEHRTYDYNDRTDILTMRMPEGGTCFPGLEQWPISWHQGEFSLGNTVALDCTRSE